MLIVIACLSIFLLVQVNILFKGNFILFMCIAYMWMLEEARRGFWIPRVWSYGACETSTRVLGINSRKYSLNEPSL